MNAINERLKQIAEYYGLHRYADFAKKTGLSHQTASNYLKGKQKPDVEKLALVKQSFENVNANWLLTGEGKMLLDDVNTDEIESPQSLEDLRELLNAKDKIITLQQEKMAALEQKGSKFVEAVQEALKPYFKTVLRNQDIIAGGLGKIILDIDDVTNENEKENGNNH